MSESNQNRIEDDLFQYEHIDDSNLDDNDEDNELAQALASIQSKSSGGNTLSNTQLMASTITQVRPSVVDDFIRNFLIKAGMKKSLDVFNAEWFELQSKGRVPPELSSNVPDIYLRNEELDQQARALREQVEMMRQVSSRAQSTWDKFRKERDYHRMNHRRVVQEKNKLIDDIRRMKNHMESYEPTIEELKKRYETTIKEKSIIKIERDRLKERVKALEEQVSTLTEPKLDSPQKGKRSATRTVRKQAVFPADDTVVNPFIGIDFDPADASKYSIKTSYKGHLNSISACAFHPKKPIFATASDDEVWKLWTLNSSELIMSGEGHKGWLSSLHFHPHGSHLATASGDGTVKVWEFAQARCSQTFTDHTQAVWGCEFHFAGDFLASCSMDHTIRVWDLISGKCRQTLRGHVDSVNAICWQPFTSNLCSASGDKTVSVWDARTGLCVQTLYGHSNSCNHVAITNQGHTLVSCDADGVVKAWDIRMVSEIGSIDAGQYPINKLSLDRGGHRAIAASDDGTIKVLDLDNFNMTASLIGHDGPVQTVAYAPNDAFFVSGSSDCTFKVWG
jgi:sperm-associated antigen 16 protein